MADLLQILEKTISNNPNDQRFALQFLEQARDQNFPEFVKQLSEVLRTTTAADFVRQAAGLQLKNVLAAKDESLKGQYLDRWLQLSVDIRQYVKENVINTLGTENRRPSIAAQCVAAIACAELPVNEWAQVISLLTQNVTHAASSELLKESSLEALGYICQDINASVLEVRANEILTGIVHGMKKQEPSNHVRLAATNALLNSLEFTRSNFSNDNERHLIMQVVCEATQSTDTPVKVASLQCLVRIMSLYYQYMEHYMGPALFSITVDAMKTPIDDIALQGIEFWSNVCEEEIALTVEAEEAEEQGRTPEHVSRHYAKGALIHLIPILTEALTKQEESDDDDEWNPAKAAGVCVMLLAQCTADDIVPVTLPFITTHIKDSNWRYRDAAIMAFGSILDGPDRTKLKTLVQQAMPMLIEALADDQTVVRDTAAWCIGRVCDSCEDVVVQPDILSPLLPALSVALNQEPRVAANVCWAISSLAAAAYETAVQQGTDDSGQPETYILSPCFEAMMSELMRATDRPDAHVSNLRIAAYETLMELIKNSPKDCYPVVQSTTLIILKKLEQLLTIENTLQSTSDKSQFRDLQSLLCATLQSVLRKMRPEDAPVVGDAIMGGLVQIMDRCSGRESGGVMEDALMTVSTLIEALAGRFQNYVNIFKPYMIAGLKNHEETQVCSAAIGVFADLCRALESNIAPYLDEIMQLLVEILSDPKVDKSVKPMILSCFGDVALAIGPSFTCYFEPVMQLLFQAAEAKADNPEDYDMVDYVQQLRENCLEAFTGIVQGFKAHNGLNAALPKELEMLKPYVPTMMQFIEAIANDSPTPESIIAAASGLIGDIVTAFGASVLPVVEKDAIGNLLTRGRRAKNAKTKSLATWATKEIRKLKSPAA